MIKRISVLISVIICVLMCITLISCNKAANKTTQSVKEGAEDIGNGVKDTVDKAGETVRNAAEDVKFTAVRFKDDLVNAGYDIKEKADSKFDKFKGTETDYYLGNDIVRIYEYNSKDELDKDVSKISPDGLTIDGVKEYEVKPYIYSKDNVLIVYEGNDSTYVSELNNKYGKPIV